MAPIHTGADDHGDRYGIWASGPDYKVSFHDGFEFYPVLGDTYPDNLPLRWRTASVRVGETELVPAVDSVSGAVGDWRYELRYPNLTEAYDVRPDGVEQTFVIHVRPASRGDLVVTGSIDTRLRVPVSPRNEHAPIEFVSEAGEPILTYGAATAIDALGSSTTMQTTFDGNAIRLRLSEDWLDAAVFPVTVDPLVRTVILSVSGGAVGDTAIAYSASPREHAIAYTRRVSAGDHDLFVRTMPDNWASPATVFTDVTTSWSTDGPDVAHARVSDKWLVGFTRRFSGGQVQVRYHLHSVGNTTLSTDYGIVTRTNGEQNFRVVVSGNESYNGTHALFVYELDRTTGPTSTTRTEVWAKVLETTNATFSGPVRLDRRGSGTYDSERPAVEKFCNDDHWNIAFQQHPNTAGAHWGIRYTRIQPDLTVSTERLLTSATQTTHHVAPKIDSTLGRIAISFVERSGNRDADPLGPRVQIRRVDWEHGGTPTLLGTGIVRSGTMLRNCGLAMDSRTRSHWTAVTTEESLAPVVHADRVGYDMELAESVQVSATTSWRPAIAWNWMDSVYEIVHASGSMLFGSDVGYPDASITSFGTSCGPGRLGSYPGHASLPHAGHERFAVSVSGAPQGTSVFAFVALARSNIDLTGLGMPGCSFLLDPNTVILSMAFDMTPGALVRVPLPTAAKGVDIYLQAAYVHSGANALSLETTNGMHARIR